MFSIICVYFDKFSFITFPYEGATEIHGFNLPELNKYANNDVKLVARGVNTEFLNNELGYNLSRRVSIILE